MKKIALAVLLLPSLLSAQVSMSEYAARRDSLAAHIDSGVVVGFGERTPVTDFGPFYQIPSFHYLTGFDEADAAFVMVVRAHKGTSTIFTMPIETRTAFYYGFRPDSAAVVQSFGTRARSMSMPVLTAYVDSLVNAGLPVYNLADYEDADFARQDSLTRGGQFIKALMARHPGLAVQNAQTIVQRLRARKSPAEIALLKKAAEISSEGHRAVLQMPQPRYEYEMQAVLEYNFTRLGAERVAYGSIVGSGERGTQLHYMKDRGDARPGDLVVIDAAAQYQGYAADITRTIPVSGTFTPAQKALYQIVRDAQAAAERNAKPGMTSRGSSDSSVAVRAKGLAALGLIESPDATYDCGAAGGRGGRGGAGDATPQCQQAQIWMIHGISHGLGVAVHDYLQGATYQVGDAFTIEPGIYVSNKFLDVLPDTPRNRAFIAKVKPAVDKYNNTGVRIEDDYVITEKGLERMSSAPREIAEIEALMKTRPARKP